MSGLGWVTFRRVTPKLESRFRFQFAGNCRQRKSWRSQFTENQVDPAAAANFNSRMPNIPSDLKYAKSHEWVRVAGDAATVGITDHAQHELTDVVFVELPAVGRKVKAGEACAVVESVKTASDIYSPVSGEVVEVNDALEGDPGLVNRDPYQKGWFFKVKIAGDAASLLDANSYRKQVEGK